MKVFAFWGEDAAVRWSVPKIKVPQKLKTHPFALKSDVLLHYLDVFSPNAEPDGTELALLLPQRGSRGLVPSPEAQAARMRAPDPSKPLELAPYRLFAITLDAVDTMVFLNNLPLDPVSVRARYRYTFGGDLLYWKQSALYALNCLVEGRLLPALARQGNRTVAYWEPQSDPEIIAALVAAMPPLCRAAAESAQKAHPAPELFDHFFRTLFDSCARIGHRRPYRQRWLRALTQPGNNVGGSPAEQSKLFEAYEAWRAQMAQSATNVFRVCFRLEEPTPGSDAWWLGYMLQATDDPTLLVDAGTVWETRGGILRTLERRFEQPQEKLLAALGFASKLFPPIERSLREARPMGVALTPTEAYEFLSEIVPLLEKSQFGTLIPNWWSRRARLKARATINAEETSFSVLNRDALINFQWEMSIGDKKVSRAEFEELVALKQPFVRFGGEWVALDPAHVQAALRFFDRQIETGQIGFLDALRLTADEASAAEPGIDVEIASVKVEGWLSDVFERLRAPDSAPVLGQPDALTGTLRPYQQRGLGWLAQMRKLGLGACLADDMGLGKSIQQLALLLYEREQLGVTGPALLVSPTSVVGNWRHEIKRFAPSLRVMVHQGPTRLSGEGFTEGLKAVDVVLTSYAILTRDVELLKSVQWASVTLDEAQNIKNPATKAAQAARSLQADHRLAMTGTPIENRLSELWSILHFLNPGYLGSREAFRTRFGVPIERYNSESAAQILRKLTTPFILRRVKTDPNVINDLPEKFENKVYCALTAEQATLYEAIVREEMEAVETAESAMQRRGNVLRMLTRLKQICNHPAHFLKEQEPSMTGRSGKLMRLLEMVDEVTSNSEAALIFTQYAEMGHLLQTYLTEQFSENVLFLHGETPSHKRDALIQQFQSSDGPLLFILSLKAGGTGLNLTRANHVFHFDRWYNPAVENQATDRAFRIGQSKNVQVHKLICLGTLEEKIDELIERKRDLADRIVGQGEGWLSEMSTDDLRDLVSLRREVMEE